MRVLFLFLDGIGLGSNDPEVNPLAQFATPVLSAMLDGHPIVRESTPLEAGRATMIALDACLGVGGMPQSASGQAALLTGVNVPALIGGHYGPWPNRAIVNLLVGGNLFRAARRAGQHAALLNAYPPTYFAAIESGRRIYSAIPQAVVAAGIPLKTAADLHAGQALSADLTGRGWRERLGLADTPLLTAHAAGERLARLAAQQDLSFFEFWLSDYAGHRQDMVEALDLLASFDEMLGGLLANWDDRAGLILLTSDHGNMEDLSTHGHTTNPVPAIIIGGQAARHRMAASLHGLPDVAPAIMRELLS